MTYSEFLSHFKVTKSYRNKAQCICPAHDDKEASLTISQGAKGIAIHCHAGCETEKVLEAVGLSMKDLFEDKPNPTGWRSYVESREKKRIEGVYHYVDLNGDYAFTRLRLSGKKFIYGIMEDDRFSYGLKGKNRKSIPAVYCSSLKSVRKAIEDGKRIFYCEGEKDVNTVNSKGLTGITCGASGDWTPGCARLFEGADVVILQDNDKSGEKLTRDVMKDIQSVTKSVRVLIPVPDVEHGDISDFFGNHPVEDLEELLKVEPIPESEKADLDQFHIINDKGKVTGVFDYEILKYLKKSQDIFVLGGTPYIYTDGAFKPDLSGAKLKTMIRELIYPEFIKSTTIKRVYELFTSDIELQVAADELNQYPVWWINFKNGFYDPVAKKMLPHDPKYRATNQIPHIYDPETKLKGTIVKNWLKYICETPDDIKMLCQFAGLCMTRDTRQQKFLILNGEGGTGKSTVIRMIDKMIGTDNISNISLSQLTQRFSAFGLMGKLLNSCADLEIDALSDVSTLKKALGEDTLAAEAKGKDAVSFKSYAKLIFSTNELPIVKAEKTNGFYRRLLILTMNRVPATPETDFFDKLSAEIDDFIGISVKALEDMYEHKCITESAGSIEAVKRLRCDSDTVEAFLNENIQKDVDSRIKKADLYHKYEAYCQDMERQSLTKQNFYRSMRTKGYGEIKTNGTEYYRGINYQRNLPKVSPEISLDEWQELKGQQTPFD